MRPLWREQHRTLGLLLCHTLQRALRQEGDDVQRLMNCQVGRQAELAARGAQRDQLELGWSGTGGSLNGGVYVSAHRGCRGPEVPWPASVPLSRAGSLGGLSPACVRRWYTYSVEPHLANAIFPPAD